MHADYTEHCKKYPVVLTIKWLQKSEYELGLKVGNLFLTMEIWNVKFISKEQITHFEVYIQTSEIQVIVKTTIYFLQ